MWAGDQPGLPRIHDSAEKRAVTSTVERFSFTSGVWSTHFTIGTPPLGVRGYICRPIDDKVYYFGGWCNHDICHHNSVNQLDTTNLKWTELASTDPDRPVMRRSDGIMITVQFDGVYHLLIIGGYGAMPTTQLPQMKYVKRSDGGWRTNEHSLFNTQTSL